MVFTIQNKSLFLKAAAFAIGNNGNLLLGRGNAGKTTFLGALCQSGASFITNSHAIIQDAHIIGMATCLRIRPNSLWWKQGKVVPSKSAIKKGEIMVDPAEIFLHDCTMPVRLKNICIIDFQGPKYHLVEKISWQAAYNYIEQFGLGINVYRLEEDLLDCYKSDYKKFVTEYQNIKDLLKDIVQNSNCYYIRSDILEESNKNEILDLLSKY